MYIEEEPLETLYIAEVSINNDKNDFKQNLANIANKGYFILQKIKSTCKCSV